MVLQYLGTGAAEGWPGMFCYCDSCEDARNRGGRDIRTRSQAMVYADGFGEGDQDARLLIDLPPDTYLHHLVHKVDFTKIGHMLITHSHPDHFIPSNLKFRGPVYTNTPPKFPMHVYGNSKVIGICEDFLESAPKGSEESYILHVVEAFVPFYAGEFVITPLPASHDNREDCLIYMIESGGKRMLYGNDTGVFNDDVWRFLQDKHFDLMSLDCTWGIHAEGTNHMGLPDILRVKERLMEQNTISEQTKIVANHFSHNGWACYNEMCALAEPHGLQVSFDGGKWIV